MDQRKSTLRLSNLWGHSIKKGGGHFKFLELFLFN
jgi:hypothetical protein